MELGCYPSSLPRAGAAPWGIGVQLLGEQLVLSASDLNNFQAQVWFDRETVDPRLRAEALQILDSVDPSVAKPEELRSLGRSKADPMDRTRQPIFSASSMMIPSGPRT